jgi:hypothetical protein
VYKRYYQTGARTPATVENGVKTRQNGKTEIEIKGTVSREE